jgi:hypothetical protein
MAHGPASSADRLKHYLLWLESSLRMLLSSGGRSRCRETTNGEHDGFNDFAARVRQMGFVPFACDSNPQMAGRLCPADIYQ